MQITSISDMWLLDRIGYAILNKINALGNVARRLTHIQIINNCN